MKMYSFLHGLLSDKKGGEIFTLFSFSHFFYIFLTLAVTVTLLLCLNVRSRAAKKKATRYLIGTALGLYAADFFLMPLAYGEIDIEKLPFHACCAMCIACFLSYRVKFLERYRVSFIMLGLISNLVYLIYPAGVMWHAVHPLSYRVIQTLLFHSTMTVYGTIALIYESDRIDVRKCYRELTVTVCMTIWAMLGNYAYNGTSDGYSHFFNWFFVVRDPFYVIPEGIAPFVMPFLNIVLFFGVEMLLHLIIILAKRARGYQKEKNREKE